MLNTGLIIIGIGVIVYLAIGFGIVMRKGDESRITASIFNPFRKNIYPTGLEEKRRMNVISEEEYEWKKSEEMGAPIGDRKE